MEKCRMYNKKVFWRDTSAQQGRFPRWELRHIYCMQSRKGCIRMGLWEILPSQLSTVQKGHHSPTYWSFSCLLLWVIFKTAALFKKKPKPALNLYIQVVTIHLHHLRLFGVSQHWGQRPNWELSLVILVISLSLVLRYPAQKLSMSLHKLCTLIYD